MLSCKRGDIWDYIILMGKQTTIDVAPLMSCLMVLIVFSYCLIIVHDGHLCTWPVLTVQRRWRSCVTWIWATGHSRCQSGTGRTPAAGCGWGSWCGGPGQSRETPGGPGGCSWRRGHSPRRNCRQMNTLILNKEETVLGQTQQNVLDV